jgi:alpha-glucoside transport system substrate-binding protein
MIRTRRRVTALFIAAMLTNTILAACSTPGSAGPVSVIGPWTGNGIGGDEYNFRQVLAAFTKKTGVKVEYQGTRALTEVLLSDIQKGATPDIAILSSLGELGQYQHNDKLHKLDDVIAPQQNTYSKQWLELQKLGTDNLYGVVVKANLKSIIWFNPHLPHPAIQTWDQLVAMGETIAKTGGTPWCLGMGATPIPAWPGTDWIEDILLHQFGTDSYQQWASGTLPWTSSQVRKAWEDWGRITATVGSRSALLTDWRDAGRPMFTNPPGCFLHHQPSFIMSSYQEYDGAPKPGTDFDFFPFPNFGSQPAGSAGRAFEVSADIAGMFNNTTQAQQLIKYLATDTAQEIWPHIGGAFSVNMNVKLNVYPDDVSKNIAKELITADALCYDAADLMPATMRNAFYRAVLEYLSDPTQLDQLLDELDGVRQGIAREEWLNIPCGQ